MNNFTASYVPMHLFVWICDHELILRVYHSLPYQGFILTLFQMNILRCSLRVCNFRPCKQLSGVNPQTFAIKSNINQKTNFLGMLKV